MVGQREALIDWNLRCAGQMGVRGGGNSMTPIRGF